jgi:hypothetical protein
MKRIALVIVALLTLVMDAVPQRTSSLRIHNGFLKAREYLDMDPPAQRAYAMGVLDGMYMAPMFGAPDNDKGLVSLATCVEGMKASQVAVIIEKYLKEHPERWHWDLKDAAYSSVRAACPIT